MDFPKTFTDSAGREWTLELGLSAESRIKEVTGYDLDDLVPAVNPNSKGFDANLALDPIRRLIGNPRKFFDIFYAIVKKTADAKGLTLEQVKDGFDTESAIVSMSKAVMGAILDFFRWDPLRRWVFPAMIQWAEKIDSQMPQAMKSEIDKIDIGAILAAQNAIESNSPIKPNIVDTRAASQPDAGK